MTHNAMKSLVGSGENREQTVFTPELILQVPRVIWGGIAYDCCHGEPGYVLNKAGRQRDGALPDDPVAAGLAVRVASIVGATRTTMTAGLTAPWPPETFCNPPYKTLKEWLACSLEQLADHIMLVPVRPQRVWWRKWAREAEIVYLNPFPFQGHTQAFPAPMCLARRNAPSWQTGTLGYVCEAFGIGAPL